MSQITKKALAASLKKLSGRKSLDKITVIDLAEDCEINRQTFYYHFKDIFDLVEWIFKCWLQKGHEKDIWNYGRRNVGEISSYLELNIIDNIA